MKRNPHFEKLAPSYLFLEVKKKVLAYKKNHPQASLINLAIGDTTLPVPQVVSQAMQEKARLLSTPEGYTGYGSEQGEEALRKKIKEVFYANSLEADDIFISDGAKCDLGRIQILFPPQVTMGVQDPSYPVYFDTGTIRGARIIRLAMNHKNNFFIDWDQALSCDVLFLSSPNNPTGHAFSWEQYEELISFAKNKNKLLILDAAYNLYIENASYPRSIFEIAGAEEVAIEVGSFSKLVNFTGVRLGWTAISPQLSFEGGQSIKQDWQRIVSTFFNGASNIAQAGGIAALSKEGLTEIKAIISYYKKNASLLKEALLNLRYEVYGGEHCPFLWVKIPHSEQSSWELFDIFLQKYGLITTPGSGFGEYGEGYLRFSALSKRLDVELSIERLCS